MAPFYDELTAHHDYELYARSLLPAAAKHGLSGRRLLDVGCGTGKSFAPMARRGWDVTACDISPRMLERARSRAERGARLEVADMRALPRLGWFNLVWSLGDAMNYLLSTAELTSALTGMRRNLAPDGIVLFDLNTLRTYRTFYAETWAEPCERARVVWTGRVDPRWRGGGLARAVMRVDGRRTRAAHLEHRQRHFRPREVLRCLERAGLVPLAVYGFESDAVFEQPLDERRHTKSLFIARRGGRKVERR